MGHYKSNLRDIEFNLFEVFGADQNLGQGPFKNLDPDSARDVLREVERLCTTDLAASFVDCPRPSRRATRPTPRASGTSSRCARSSAASALPRR